MEGRQSSWTGRPYSSVLLSARFTGSLQRMQRGSQNLSVMDDSLDRPNSGRIGGCDSICRHDIEKLPAIHTRVTSVHPVDAHQQSCMIRGLRRVSPRGRSPAGVSHSTQAVAGFETAHYLDAQGLAIRYRFCIDSACRAGFRPTRSALCFLREAVPARGLQSHLRRQARSQRVPGPETDSQ